MAGFYIFCDESLKKGKYYSNFYGGLIIDKIEFEKVKNALTSRVQDLEIENSELKWGNVNTFKLEQYKSIIDTFFEFIKANVIKVRIMFTDNRFIANNLTKGLLWKNQINFRHQYVGYSHTAVAYSLLLPLSI